MKLKICDMKAETDKVAKKKNYYFDLLDISTKVDEEEDSQLFQGVRSLYLYDENGNSDPRIIAHF